MENKRGNWTSNIGFLLATSGAAIGLGNLWRFPYIVGQNGGFIFLLIFIFVVVLIGVPIMMSEFAMGRNAESSAFRSFTKINKKFGPVGIISIICAFIILSYYSVIGGWVLKYLFTYLTGGAISATFFGSYIGQTIEPLFWHFLFMLMVVVICSSGIKNGIERASAILLPALFIMLIVVAIRSCTLPGADAGLNFLFKPNFEKIADPNIYMSAISQAFFSLSIGMAVNITYGSYMQKKDNLIKSALTIPFLDTMAGLLASLAIMPAVFAAGLQPTAGPGLIFQTLPTVFESIPFGGVFAVVFFFLALFAALTSAIALLEVNTSFTIDEFKWGRKTSAFVIGGVIFLLGVPSSLANGVMANVSIFGMNFMDFMSFLTDNIILPLSGIAVCIAVGYFWKIEDSRNELTNQGTIKFRLFTAWRFIIRYIAPIFIGILFINGIFPFIK